MLRGLFVTGTDTGVGKTVVSAALMLRLRAARRVRYWKPVQTGIEKDDDTAAVKSLARCSNAEIFDRGIRLPIPVSPHLAARLNGTAIDVEQVVGEIQRAPDGDQRCWIVEGAGGVLVPVNQTQTMADMMTALALPVIVATRTALGTINHTLLTLEALRTRGLMVAGVVMVGDRHDENRAAIEQFGDVPVLGEMPCLGPLTPDRLQTWALSDLDRDGRLIEALR